MKELAIEAKTENVDKVIEFINEELDKLGCLSKIKIEINVAADELFANIANYAYKHEIGKAKVRVEVKDNPKAIVVTFIDNGIPFNPLEKADPNVSLSADERNIGGLGIYIVKKTMDKVEYEYKDNQNILTITKNINV